VEDRSDSFVASPGQLRAARAGLRVTVEAGV
jgi:hypothetical protein